MLNMQPNQKQKVITASMKTWAVQACQLFFMIHFCINLRLFMSTQILHYALKGFWEDPSYPSNSILFLIFLWRCLQPVHTNWVIVFNTWNSIWSRACEYMRKSISHLTDRWGCCICSLGYGFNSTSLLIAGIDSSQSVYFQYGSCSLRDSWRLLENNGWYLITLGEKKRGINFNLHLRLKRQRKPKLS